MAIFVPLHPVPLQFVDGNGDPLSGATLSFFLSGTSTPTNLFSDSSGTSIGTTITTNAEGYPESGGNVITLFRDTSIDYKITLNDGSVVWTSDTINSEIDVLSSAANGEGASLVSIEDSGARYTATDVEAALAELRATPSATVRTALELATSAEIDTGADTTRAIPIDQAQASSMLGWDQGSFAVTWPNTTFTIADSHTWYYVRMGQIVVAFFTANVSGTSNATTFNSDTAVVPAAIRPNSGWRCAAEIEDNGTRQIGWVNIRSTGQIQVLREDASASFTASGTKSLHNNYSLTWFLGDETGF